MNLKLLSCTHALGVISMDKAEGPPVRMVQQISLPSEERNGHRPIPPEEGSAKVESGRLNNLQFLFTEYPGSLGMASQHWQPGPLLLLPSFPVINHRAWVKYLLQDPKERKGYWLHV